jgi:hypothetical protein
MCLQVMSLCISNQGDLKLASEVYGGTTVCGSNKEEEEEA